MPRRYFWRYVSVGVTLVGLLRIPGTRRSRPEWARFGLDIATVIVTVLVFGWHLRYPAWSAGGLAGTWSALAVIGGGFICVSRSSRSRSPVRCIARLQSR